MVTHHAQLDVNNRLDVTRRLDVMLMISHALEEGRWSCHVLHLCQFSVTQGVDPIVDDRREVKQEPVDHAR